MPFPSHIADIQPFVELHVSSWASVYKAYQPSLDRVVLLKVLNPSFNQQEENAGWFKSEAQLTAKVKHPNVVSVYGYGESEDGLYFTTEFVEGITLREVVERGPVPYPLSVYILEQMLTGLQAAHDRDVLHRDLKPENVLISFDGYVKLCDFGFASMISAGEKNEEIRGTIGYIAPELILDGIVDEGGDMFAVGAVLYEMLVGKRAFVGEDINGYVHAVEQQDIAASLSSYTFIPLSVRNLCANLLHKNRSIRPVSTAKALERVRSIQKSEDWDVSSEVLGKWWENPNTYQIPEPKKKNQPDKEPVIRDQLSTEEKQRSRVWKISLALFLLAITVFFVNGVARQTYTSDPKGEVIREFTSLNSAQVSTVDEDSLASTILDSTESHHQAEIPEPELPPASLSNTDSLPKSVQSEQIDTVRIPVDSLLQIDGGEGKLTVLCLPSCSVQIDEERKGDALPSMTMDLPVGHYQVALDNPDFPPFGQEIEVSKGKHDTLIVSLLESVGTLELEVSPWGEVFIDSTSYGVFPPSNPIKIWPGEHTLRVVHKELGERKLTFTIGATERLSRKINFNDPKPRTP